MADRDSARANILVMVPKLTACCSFPWQTVCPDSAKAKILVMVPKLTACSSFPRQTECPDSAKANILVMVPNLPLAVLSHGRQNVLTLQEQIY
jgi:hypothetical protein